jgi:hypothetical protein
MSPRRSKDGADASSGGGGASKSTTAGIRWFAILAISLLLWAPSGMAALEGTLTMDGALLRYALALALCWMGISALTRIMDTYSREQARKRLEQEVEERAAARAKAKEEAQRRRSEDHS